MPELAVLTIDSTTGEVHFISQSTLNVPNGDTTFTIKNDSANTGVEFESSGSSLVITTSNPDYVAVAVTSGSNTTTVSFDPVGDFITGSAQLNAISYSTKSVDFITNGGYQNGPSDWQNEFYNRFFHTGGGYTPSQLANDPDSVPDYVTPAYYTEGSNRGTISFNLAFLGAVDNKNINGGTWISSNPTSPIAANRLLHKIINDGPYTSSRYNLWINPNATTNVDAANPTVATLDPNAENDPFHVISSGLSFDRRRNYAWLSASLVGGFTVGNKPSLSASLSEFTASISTNSSSVGTLKVDTKAINDNTSSMALNSFTSSFLTSIEASEIDSIYHNGPIDQVTIIDNPNAPQGKIIQLGGTAPGSSPLEGYDATSRHLTISGTFTANDYALGGDGVLLQQMNVQSVGGGITYGTSSLHRHRFIGGTFITGGISVTGPVSIGSPLPSPPQNLITNVNNTGTVSVLVSDNGTIKLTEINGSNVDLNNEIESTANAVSESFVDRIATIQSNIDQATPDGDNITLLQSGYNTLSSTFTQGISFHSASTATLANADTFTGGFSQNLGINTASFTSSVAGQIATSLLHHDLLTVSHSVSGDTTSIHYIFNTSSFINALDVYVTTQSIIDDVDGLNRYGKLTEGIITGSTDANIEYIANLATELPGGAGKHFLTGSGQLYEKVTNLPTTNGIISIFNNATTGTVGQGTFDFYLDTGSSPIPTFSVKLKDLSETAGNNNPIFTNVTASSVTVEGTLVQINKSNLNIQDQFVLLNSGTLAEGIVSTANDPDGGIIVAQGDSSGSMFMYDNSHQRWGFIGADGNDLQALDVQSNDSNTLTPKLGLKTIVHSSVKPSLFNSDGTPKDISNFNYGKSSEDTQLGIMAINEGSDEGDVFIYA